jgi:hypothetical protein
MTLLELKQYFENQKEGKVFNYSLSEPFSWRGIYAEVAFDLLHKKATREEILDTIDLAYTQKFYGYKGGTFRYNDYTEIHFEKDSGCYTDGEYCAALISNIEGSLLFRDQETRLINVAFD